jgi:hypothetical protein
MIQNVLRITVKLEAFPLLECREPTSKVYDVMRKRILAPNNNKKLLRYQNNFKYLRSHAEK